ncbi:MAG TPA: 16S rRNA (cytidine(1402)-2'-O)-methyltransferase, partial [Planctomycetota bacterium]|nr:16S rRNA (cytidine(1402)-2'-O)-methyltransferase [Planctomycetota bacterium]
PHPAYAPVSGNALAPGLYLVPTPIGNLADITPRALQILTAADCIACEDTRRTGLLLHLIGLPKKRLICIEAHRESAQVADLIARLQQRQIVALVSDGGTPCLSDPGRWVVQAAQAADLPIISLPGASAITAAYAASGFPPPWTFYGFLARKGAPRRAALTTIAERTSEAAILFESPFRLLALLKELAEDVRYQDRPLVLAQEISKIHETFHRGSPAGLLEQLSARAAIKGEWTVMIGPRAGSDETDENNQAGDDPAP